MRRPLAIVVYQHPIDDAYHGGTVVARQLLTALLPRFDLTILAPRSSPNGLTAEPSDGPLRNAAFLLRVLLMSAKSIRTELFRPRTARANLLIVIDAYAGLPELVWSRIIGRRVVYYAFDSPAAAGEALGGLGPAGLVPKVLRALTEWALLRCASTILAVSPDLANQLASGRTSRAEVLVAPLVRRPSAPNRDRIAETRRRLGLVGRLGIIFVGNCTYSPNVRAANVIIKRLLPEIVGGRLPAKLILAGVGTKELQSADSDFLVKLGPVDDLDSLLYACDIGLAPSDVEGGTSVKIIDYLVHGLNVVATPRGARGIMTTRKLHLSSQEEIPKFTIDLVRRLSLDETLLRHEIDSDVRLAYQNDSELEKALDCLSSIVSV